MLIIEKDFATASSRGRRQYQEDYVLVSNFEDLPEYQGSILLVLADGMGGYNAGDAASKIAVNSFFEHFYDTPIDVRARLLESLHYSNDSIAHAISQNTEFEGMGTTLVGALISDNTLQWVSVGDSPMYLFRNNSIARLNEDHSMMPILRADFNQGKLTQHELENHNQKNELRSALIGTPIDLIDCPNTPINLNNSDILIVASDGIDSLELNKINSELINSQSLSAKEISNHLVSNTLSVGKERQDNVTVGIIKISS